MAVCAYEECNFAMLGFCLEWNVFTDVFQQIKNDKGYQVEAGQQKQMKCPRKPSSCPSSKRRPSTSPRLSEQEREGNPISRAQPGQRKYIVMSLRDGQVRTCLQAEGQVCTLGPTIWAV